MKFSPPVPGPVADPDLELRGGGGGGGGGGGLDLFALFAFFPSVISSLFAQNKGGGAEVNYMYRGIPSQISRHKLCSTM